MSMPVVALYSRCALPLALSTGLIVKQGGPTKTAPKYTRSAKCYEDCEKMHRDGLQRIKRQFWTTQTMNFYHGTLIFASMHCPHVFLPGRF